MTLRSHTFCQIECKISSLERNKVLKQNVSSREGRYEEMSEGNFLSLIKITI